MRLESKTYIHPDGNITNLVPSERRNYYLVGLHIPVDRTRKIDRGNQWASRLQPRNILYALQHLVGRNSAKHH